MSSFGRVEESRTGLEPSSSLAEQAFLEWYGIYPQKREHILAYQVIKRLIDLCVAVAGLVILGCLLPLIALLYLVLDPGPIFYRQQRVGKDFRPFTLYKLRTMIVDADGHLARNPALKAAWSQTGKLQNDPRVTRLGNFLRRCSLDELPQFLNMLRGELSLVGPRPIQFSEIPIFGELITLRQSIKPGLTGFWQISGRSNTDYNQRAILDCIYVVDRSLWVDLLIIFNTIPVVIRGWGAY